MNVLHLKGMFYRLFSINTTLYFVISTINSHKLENPLSVAHEHPTLRLHHKHRGSIKENSGMLSSFLSLVTSPCEWPGTKEMNGTFKVTASDWQESSPLLFIIEWKEGLYKYTSSSFYKNFSFCMYTL